MKYRRTLSGEIVETILSLKLLDKKEDTYNLMVKDTHTYIADGFRVHNAYNLDDTVFDTDPVMYGKEMDTVDLPPIPERRGGPIQSGRMQQGGSLDEQQRKLMIDEILRNQ